MASKHFPVDFFNQKLKKQSMPMQTTNDETIGTSIDNERGNLSDIKTRGATSQTFKIT